MKRHSFLSFKKSIGPRMLVFFAFVLFATVGSAANAQHIEVNFNHFTLDQAANLALGNSEFLQQVQAEIDGSKGSLTAAQSGRLPHLDLTGQYARNLKKQSFFLPPAMGDAFGVSGPVPMGSDNEVIAAISVTYNLWTAGRLSAAESVASQLVTATRFQKMAAADGVLFTVIVAYHDVLLASENLKTAQKSLIAAEESQRVAESGYAQGTLSNFDHLRARVETANRQAPLIAARNDLDQAMLVLERRCGLPPASIVSLADSLGGVATPAEQDDLVAQMLQTSSEIRALSHAVAAAKQGVVLQKAGKKPAVLLSGSYALQGQWDNGVGPDNNQMANSSNVALGLSWPIFDGKRTSGLVSRASADLLKSELELARVTKEKELSVRQARLALENSLAALEGRTEAVSLAEEAFRLALVRMANGLATPLEKLDAEVALTSARVQQSTVKYACNIAEARLALAVGNASATYLRKSDTREIEK